MSQSAAGARGVYSQTLVGALQEPAAPAQQLVSSQLSLIRSGEKSCEKRKELRGTGQETARRDDCVRRLQGC